MDLNTIYLEDCMKTMSKMGTDAVDITVTSPPYNIGNRMNAGFNKLKYDNTDDYLTIEQYQSKTKEWVDECLRVTRDHVFWNVQELTNNKGIVNFILNNYEDVRKETFIWVKTNPSPPTDKVIKSSFEYIFCFSKDQPEKRSFTRSNFSNYNGDQVSNVIIKPANTYNPETTGHGYAYPDWLPEYFIRYFSKPGAVVYDPFMGTGTTAKAALNLGRSYIGSEISEKYFNHAEERLKPYLRATQTNLF